MGQRRQSNYKYNVCVLGGQMGNRRPDDLLTPSLFNSSVFRIKRKSLQMFTLLSMALKALSELILTCFPCYPSCAQPLCVSRYTHISPFPFSPTRPTLPSLEMMAPLLQHLPHLSRPLIFFLFPSHFVVNQFPCFVLIIWMCVPLLPGLQLPPGDLIHKSSYHLLNTCCELGAALMLYMHFIQSSQC